MAKNTKENREEIQKIRDARIQKLKDLLLNFVNDLARLHAGNEVTFDYLDPSVASTIQKSALSFLKSGDRMQPDFGDFAQADIYNNFLDEENMPVEGMISFKDKSIRKQESGANFKTDPIFVELYFIVSSDLNKIINYRIEFTE